VDEAGDPILFGSKGRVIVGKEGCSRFFILGLLDVPDPTPIRVALESLRAQLLEDPYFRGVPSMQIEARKTALAFHAKDDLPEVRKEVLRVLAAQTVHFYAVIKDKAAVYRYVRQQNERQGDYRYSPNELYDLLVRRLFRDRLHQADSYQITFARRGKADRTLALREALETARKRYAEKWGIAIIGPVEIKVTSPYRSSGLQAADYFLWTLQRCFERGEDRFLSVLWPRVSLVVDMDDTRKAAYGAYYNQKTPLTAASINGRPGI